MRFLHHGSSRLAVGFAALLPLLLTACASPGPPRPPSLHLPGLVSDLGAQRVANQVELHWTTPSKTTDDLDLKGPLTAEICREAESANSRTCTPVNRLPVHPGPSEGADLLPDTLTADPAMLIAYRVQIFNSADRSAGLSNRAFAATGAAPQPVEQLRATPSRSGATLEWQPVPTLAYVELSRTLLTPAPKPTKAEAQKPLVDLSPDKPANVRLRTGKGAQDPGGTLDNSAEKGQTYTYQAQRVRPVVLDGHALELRSALSAPLTVVIADTFPPQPPTGLAAVPGDSANTIDLSWQPVADTDLAGYLVYRRQAGCQCPFKKLTAAPIVGPAFSDTTAKPGERYNYRVTAIDSSGNESQPSNEVEELTEPNKPEETNR